MNPTAAVVIGMCAAIGLAAGASVARMRTEPVVIPIDKSWHIDRTNKGDRLPLPPDVSIFDNAEMFPPAPIDPLPVVGPPKPAAPPRDPVCGPKGRNWYRKDGWSYWRCVR